ncbi:MAG: DNA polymerase III subunit beta [bacterium]
MKIESVKEKLAHAVAKAEKVTGRNASLPILKCIFIEAQDNSLTIKATNLDLGIEIQIPVKVTEKGQVAAPGTILNGFLSNVGNEKSIILETIENNLHVSTSKNSTIIKSFSPEEFPSIPRIESPNGFNIASEDFIEGLRSVSYSSATSTIKPELSSVKIYPEGDSIVFVATDGFRLAEKKVRTKKGVDFPAILVPIKNVSEIIRIIDDIKAEISILIDKNQMAIMVDDLYLVSRTTEGNFPNYKAIFPKEFTSEVTILKQDLINSLKLSTIFTDTFNHVKLTVHSKEKQMEIISKNNEVGENSSLINATVKGDDLSLNFNFRYISDAFNSLKADSLTFMFSGTNTPLVIKVVNDDSFSYVVMPMNR